MPRRLFPRTRRLLGLETDSPNAEDDELPTVSAAEHRRALRLARAEGRAAAYGEALRAFGRTAPAASRRGKADLKGGEE